MRSALAGMCERFDALTRRMGEPDLLADREAYRKTAKERAELEEVVRTFRRHEKIRKELEESREVLRGASEAELRELAREEIARLEAELEEAERRLKRLMVPRDPNDEKNVILEIRAGTGGEEAALFAAELSRMYLRFAERRRWRAEIVDSSPTELGGYKEVIAEIQGDRVYSFLRHESGTHRVQRVPETESGGRIHTSAVTVAVLPEAEEVEVEIDPAELRVDVYRSSGPGGQSVNTTDSAVRVTHLPTGMIVTCQDEKSQHKNKAKALKVLRARLLDAAVRESEARRSQARRSQVGTGDRSGRIRTYNFPQGRVTDHRINLTLHKLEAVLGGGLEDLIEPLMAAREEEVLTDFERAVAAGSAS
ncbi:MAG: peptide chain release factor 1 [Candidatus Tectomicrobia bacterium]|nr:peptide chain release factor 1 [Candidatus Tectomicrobia bacterium]